VHSDRCSEHHACAGVQQYVIQVLCALSYTFAYTLTAECSSALMYVQFVHLARRNEDEGVRLVYEGTSVLLGVGSYFLTEGKILVGVLSVSSLFLTRVGAYVGVCVCIRAHTHTLHRWGTRL